MQLTASRARLALALALTVAGALAVACSSSSRPVGGTGSASGAVGSSPATAASNAAASSASASGAPSSPGSAAASTSAAPRPPELAFAASPDDVVDAMLALANVGREDVVFDLGCGDGRILVAAAKRGARAVGFDVDPARVAEAREAARRAGVAELVRVEEADMFAVDLSPATVVTLYLSPEYNQRLLPQLAKLRFGARVVSNDFEIPGVPARQTISVVPRVPAPGVRRRTEAYRVHLWRAPLPDPVPAP